MAQLCGQGNPDISGIGVRLSFYIQNFLLVLLVDRSWEDARGTLWTLISTGFGLTVAAIVQAKQSQLSFFQALQVSNLVWLGNFGSFLALASHSRHSTQKPSNNVERGYLSRTARAVKQDRSQRSIPNLAVKLGVVLELLFSMAFTLVVWAKPQLFSDDPGDEVANCNVKYVAIFGVSLPARSSGRIFALTLTSILVLTYIIITIHELQYYYSHMTALLRRRAEHRDPEPLVIIGPADEPSDQATPTASPPPAFPEPQLPVPNHSRSRQSVRISRTPSPSSARTQVEPHSDPYTPDMDPTLIGILFCQVIIFTYFVASTELLLKRNPDSDNANQDWGFGQILALILIVPSLSSVIYAIKEHGFRIVHRPLRGRPSQNVRNNGGRQAIS